MRHHILAIDDEPHMLTLLERIINEKTEHRITTTSNSLEVPGLLEETEYDLIISDLKMPGMNGIDILRYIKEHRRSEVVILITAFGTLESATEALSQGVFDYIVKPFKKEQIIFTVERAMQWQRVKREATELGKLFDPEPYELAEESFKREYIRRLAKRSDNDIESLARKSGLSPEFIRSVIDTE